VARYSTLPSACRSAFCDLSFGKIRAFCNRGAVTAGLLRVTCDPILRALTRKRREKDNRRFTVALILSTIPGFAAAAPASVIIGYIVDENGMPVPEASIKALHVNAGPPWSSPLTSTSPLIIA